MKDNAKKAEIVIPPFKNAVSVTDILIELLCKQFLELAKWIFPRCFAAVRLLLPDEAVQFGVVLFLLAVLGLKHKIHLPDDVLCDRTGDVFFQGLVVCCYYFCQHITDQ